MPAGFDYSTADATTSPCLLLEPEKGCSCPFFVFGIVNTPDNENASEKDPSAKREILILRRDSAAATLCVPAVLPYETNGLLRIVIIDWYTCQA